MRLAAAAAACVAGAAAASGVPPFYAASPRETSGPAGTLIRREPLGEAAPEGASAFRILYRSRGLRGEPIAVSGVLVVPAGAVPAAGRPVVAWQHPTSGVEPACAPSLSPSVLAMIQGLPAMLRQGYVVVATDYPGLGTAGPHAYLDGRSEGRAVLDAVRAARRVPEAHAGTRFVAWGHSQGGHATLFAGWMARDYAPELRLAGVAAAAPATGLARLLRGSTATADGRLLTAMLLRSWSRVLDAPLGEVIAGADEAAVDLLGRQCFDPPLDRGTQPAAKPMPSATYALRRELDEAPAWRRLLASNTPPALAAGTPVFLAQGEADVTIRPEVTADYAGRLCRAGDAVRLVAMPGVDHRFIGRDSAAAAVAWIGDRFAGRPAPDDCRAGRPR